MAAESDSGRSAHDAAGAAVALQPLPPDRLLVDFAGRVRRHLGCRAAVIRIAPQFARLFSAETQGSACAAVSRVPLCALASDPAAGLPCAARSNPALLSDPVAAGELGYGFFAGLPLGLASGEPLGMLAAVDAAPRELSGNELATLRMLAAFVVQIGEFRLATAAIGARAGRRA